MRHKRPDLVYFSIALLAEKWSFWRPNPTLTLKTWPDSVSLASDQQGLDQIEPRKPTALPGWEKTGEDDLSQLGFDLWSICCSSMRKGKWLSKCAQACIKDISANITLRRGVIWDLAFKAHGKIEITLGCASCDFNFSVRFEPNLKSHLSAGLCLHYNTTPRSNQCF